MKLTGARLLPRVRVERIVSPRRENLGCENGEHRGPGSGEDGKLELTRNDIGIAGRRPEASALPEQGLLTKAFETPRQAWIDREAPDILEGLAVIAGQGDSFRFFPYCALWRYAFDAQGLAEFTL